VNRREFGDLLAHMEWADALTWRSALATTGAPRDERLIGLLHHLHQVQSIYLYIWRREAPQITSVKDYEDGAALAAWARPWYSQALALVDALDEPALSGPVEFPWADQIAARYGAVGPVTVRDSILQVVMHSTYHRGQIATRVRELGGEPALTDYVVWVWGGKPAPEWGSSGAAL
jgi:uncharacterized damage-inducible protein DinB